MNKPLTAMVSVRSEKVKSAPSLILGMELATHDAAIATATITARE